MKTMKVKDLRQALRGAPDNARVVFQANEPCEEDKAGEATQTFAYGTVFSAFLRGGHSIVKRGDEFVIDGATTNRE